MSDGPVERREPITDAEVVSPASVTHPASGQQFDASDLALNRLRVVGKDAALVNLNVAQPADIAIGIDSEDEDSTVYPAPGNVKVYVIGWRVNYACGYGEQQGQWDEGDPSMPACAKKQYHATLFIPQFDRIMPVVYTANGSAAKTFRSVITAVVRNGIATPYTQAFELSTKMCTGNPQGAGPKSWPCPVFKLVEADPEEVKIAQGLHEQMVGSPRPAIGSGSSTPTF